MATRKPENKVEITKLSRQVSEFKEILKNRIQLGFDILKRNVNDMEDFALIKKEYQLWNDYNEEFLKQSFNNPANEYKKDYIDTDKLGAWVFGGHSSPSEQLLEFKETFNGKIDNLSSLLQKADLLKVDDEIIIQASNSKNDNKPLDKTKVFIVHGHDDLAKMETARFIELLGFEAIILHEQINSGKTIIEKIESYTDVGFGIVLYTPCDVGSKRGEENNLKNRSRQNVVFEHGYLIAKIGRENVTALVKGSVETPNDISGVVYISMIGDWKLEIAKELRNSGYNIDMNKVI